MINFVFVTISMSKNIMRLLSAIKSTCVVIGIIIIGDMYSMESEKKPIAKELAHAIRGKELFNYKETANGYIRQFPLMSPELAHYRYNRCDDKVKKEIEEKLAAKIDEYCKDDISLKEIFSGIFIAIKIPQELRLMCAQRMFDDNEEVSYFLGKPIRQMHEVERYPWVKKVQEGKAARNFVSSICRYDNDKKLTMEAHSLDTSFLLQYHNEINKVNDCFSKAFTFTYQEAHYLVDYDDVKALCILNEAINRGEKDTKKLWQICSGKYCIYRSYDTYTLTNFLHRLKENKIILAHYTMCMIPIVAFCISRFIELNYCQKILTESDVTSNKDVIVFNEWLKAKVQNIDPDILPYTRIDGYKSIIEPHYSWLDFFKKDSPLFLTVPLVLPGVFILTERDEQRLFDWNNFFNFLVTNVTAMPIVSYCILKPISLYLSELLSLSGSGFVCLSSLVTGFFCGCAFIKTLIDMRSWRQKSTYVKYLPALLKECDDGLIVMEEKQ